MACMEHERPRTSDAEDVVLKAMKLRVARDNQFTPEQKRLQAQEGQQRYTEEERRETHSLQYRSGFALDAPFLLREDMPAYLREDRPPFYAFIPEQEAPEIHPLLEFQSVSTRLGHPTKGIIQVLVPQRAPTRGRILVHEEYHEGTGRLRSRDYSCGPWSRVLGARMGTFDGDEEEMAYSAHVVREFYDADGTRLIGKRVLADFALLGDRRDLFPYAHEVGADGWDTATWVRKGNGLTGRMVYDPASGARRRLEYSNGMVAMYAGDRGNERMLTMTRDPAISDGVVREFYAGKPGHAFLTRKVYADGTIKFYSGTTPGFVHVNKIWHADGRTELFAGDWRGVTKVGEGHEPREGEQTVEPSPGLVRAVLALCDGLERQAPQEELHALSVRATELSSAMRVSEMMNSTEDAFEAGANQAARAFADGLPFNPRAACLAHFVGVSPRRAAEIIESYEGVKQATDLCAAKLEQHSAGDPNNQAQVDILEGELAASFKLMTDKGVSKEEAKRVINEFLAEADAKARAMSALGVSGATVGPEEVERITRTLAHATMNKAFDTVRPATKRGAASSAAAAAPPPPPRPAPKPDEPKVLRIGVSHRRTDLHGKRVKIVPRAGKLREGQREVEFLDAPLPKPPKGETRWVVLATDLVKESEWLAARATKEAERAAKAESDKARRRANKLSKQLESDARLAAQLQEEEKQAVARAARPGPPPEGQRPLREQVRCPIDGALLEDAVLASDGYVYNKSSLQTYWNTKESLVSPVTGAAMTSVLCRHNPIRSVVKELIATPAKGESVPAEEPDLVLCPISQEVMQAPVLAEDGNLYDRATLEQWFATGATSSPLTNTAMGQRVLEDRHVAVLCAAWRG